MFSLVDPIALNDSSLEKLDDEAIVSALGAYTLIKSSRFSSEDQLMGKDNVNNRSDFDDKDSSTIKLHGDIHFHGQSRIDSTTSGRDPGPKFVGPGPKFPWFSGPNSGTCFFHCYLKSVCSC